MLGYKRKPPNLSFTIVMAVFFLGITSIMLTFTLRAAKENRDRLNDIVNETIKMGRENRVKSTVKRYA